MKKKTSIVIMAFILVALLSACTAITPEASNQPAVSNQPAADQNQDATASQDPVGTQPAAEDTATIRVGALLHTTGIWSKSGIGAEKALEIGLPYVNYYLKDFGIQIELDIRDTGSDPEKALSELKSLHEEGINTVIGPMTSEESVKVLQYADENSILLLSPSATSTVLSQKDNFFRMVATDSSQVDGLTRIMRDSYQIEHLVPVYMDDTYGRGYNELLGKMSGSQEMDVAGSVSISPTAPDYRVAAGALEKLLTDADNTNTAVVLITTEQMAAELIKTLPQDGKASSVKWFASTDIVGDQEILADQQVAAFAEKTGMEGLAMGYKDVALDALPYVGSLLEGAIEYSPYALTTWDALWLLADTYGKAPDADFDTLKKNLVDCAKDYRNAFGSFNGMDENGDTKSSRYMRYIFSEENGSYTWRCKGHYVNLGVGDPIIQTIEWEVSPDAGEVLVGALLPLSGGLSEDGKETESILNYAVENFNQYAKECGSDLQLKLVVEDTGSDPAKAEAAVQKIMDMGIKNIIGPIGSSELEKVKPLLDNSGMICISPLSTSPSLSTPDKIYRLILNDNVQTKALSALMNGDGIEKVVIIHRDDTYGSEMAAAFKENFKGEVVCLPYQTNESDYSAVVQQADEAVKGGDAAKTAVLAVSYDEIVEIMKQASDRSSLKEVRWYGTDSSARSKALLADQNAAGMAAGVNYTALDYTPYGKYFDPLYQVVNYKLQPGQPFRESVISSFDGIWLLGCAYLQEGTSADIDTINQYVSSNSFRGVGGVLALDENGDRQFGYYKVYHVTTDQDTFVWKNNGLFSQDFINKGVLEMYE